MNDDLSFWLEHHYFTTRKYSDSTTKHYRLMLKNFGEFLGRPPRIEDLTADKISGAVLYVERLPGRSPATAEQRRHYLLALARWLARRGHCPWPEGREIYKPTVPESNPKAWRKEQLAAILATCKKLEGRIDGIRASAWWRGLFLALWDTGERISAILAATWDNYDRDAGTLYVPASDRKGKKKAMIYHLRGDSQEALRLIYGHRERIFPWPYHWVTIYNRLRKINKLAGLPTDRKSKFHRMRVSFASHLEAAGGNATDALRHTSRRVTVESYLDRTITQPEPPNRKLFRIDESPPMPPEV